MTTARKPARWERLASPLGGSDVRPLAFIHHRPAGATRRSRDAALDRLEGWLLDRQWVAAPDRQVVAVMGDGGVMFTLTELAAAAAERMALPLIVIDNGGYGQIRKNMTLRGYTPLGVDFPSPDFAAAGRALECHGVSIQTPDELSEELAKALVADRPTVLHVIEGGRA